MNPTAHLHVVLMLGICGAVLLFPSMVSWHDVFVLSLFITLSNYHTYWLEFSRGGSKSCFSLCCQSVEFLRQKMAAIS